MLLPSAIDLAISTASSCRSVLSIYEKPRGDGEAYEDVPLKDFMELVNTA